MSTDTLTHPPDTQRVPPGGWRIDPARSSVEFRTPTLWGLATVDGRFERYDGSLDLQRSPAIELMIDAASLSTKTASATGTCAPPTSSTSRTIQKSASCPIPRRWTVTR